MDLSIVVPAYNEAQSLPALYERLRDALSDERLSWELIVVDDGSTDLTFEVVSGLHARDPRVHGLGLSRNFGHQLALYAGLRAARGRAVVTIDADLEYPPELIPELLRLWRAGAAIVHTVRDDRQSGLPVLKRLTSRLFYWLFRRLSGLDLQPGMADFRLFDRTVVDLMVASPDHQPFFRGFAAWVGFPQAEARFVAGRRLHGRSRYTLSKMLSLALSGLIGYSARPLYASLAAGLAGLALSVGYAVYAFYVHFVTGTTLPGWTSIVVLVSLLTSMQFVVLGILGLYVAEISRAVRGRPNVVVARVTPDTLVARRNAAASSGPAAGPR
jgi:dolichol-phosphate mannosyltransferase